MALVIITNTSFTLTALMAQQGMIFFLQGLLLISKQPIGDLTTAAALKFDLKTLLDLYEMKYHI